MFNLQKYKDTIAAIATGGQNAAIAVIRVSGENSFDIVEKIFYSPKNKKIKELQGFRILYGYITDGKEQIDEVLISKFIAPHSYTGENMIEISCHGSLYIQQKILNLIIKAGARMAEPGEFTLRAFLNGKIDLSQAEAIADLIAARSEAERKMAFNHLKGHFSKKLQNLRKQLIDFVSLLELELDFAEEDVEFADRQQLHSLIEKTLSEIKNLIDSFNYGNAVKNGIPVAIVGEPNVGKSTLLNLLLKEDKAIVSDIPGTTRDAIEDIISINGIMFRFIDTAGIRETTDKIENLGIQKTKEKISKSEIVIILIDAQKPETSTILDKLSNILLDKKIIIAINKIDKVKNIPKIKHKNAQIIEISAKKGININLLEKALLNAINFNQFADNPVILTNTRHYEALQKSFNALLRAQKAIENNISQEFISQDIREALHYIGEITGEITTDEILGNIFKNFCIGK